MNLFRLIALPAAAMAAAALAPSAPLQAAPARHAAPARDWTRVVSATPEGGFRIGNPAAKTRLIEYVSYTCPHCGHFAAEAHAPLTSGWIAKGTLSLEIRNIVRDRFDLAAALLAHCGGVARFPGNHDALFANQTAWFDKAQAYEAANSGRPANPNHTAMLTDIADKTGLIALMQKRGLTPAQSRACLADQKAVKALFDRTQKAVEQDKVTGTPSFAVNGRLVEAHSWAELRPLLPAPAR